MSVAVELSDQPVKGMVQLSFARDFLCPAKSRQAPRDAVLARGRFTIVMTRASRSGPLCSRRHKSRHLSRGPAPRKPDISTWPESGHFYLALTFQMAEIRRAVRSLEREPFD